MFEANRRGQTVLQGCVDPLRCRQLVPVQGRPPFARWLRKRLLLAEGGAACTLGQI